MGYSGRSNPTPPRSLRVILGAVMVNVSVFFGTTMFTHEYHRALSMSDEPSEMTWEELTERGLQGNSFVRLTNIRIAGVRTEEEIFENLMATIDPDTPPEELEAKVAEAMMAADEDAGFGESFEPTVLVSADVDVDAEESQRVVIPAHANFQSIAMDQLDLEGSITGYVSSYDGDEFAKTVMTMLGYDTEQIEEELADRPQVFTLIPMSESLNTSDASSRFWMMGLCLSFGLILCGSGAPSIVCCFFFWWPSVLSMIGYPMRYGRGGWLTRLIYMGIGATLLGYGYKLMIVDGRFGSCSGDPFLHALGFISTFVGLAGVMCVPIQFGVRKFVESTEVKPARKSRRLSYEQACAMKPAVPEGVETEYHDRKLVANRDVELPGELLEMIESLASLGFASPITGQWKGEETLALSAITLGCENMVLCDIEVVDGVMQTRLVSVLHDGMAIITRSNSMSAERESRLGTNGFYTASESNDPLQMMSLHLRETQAMSEKRDSTIVKMDPEESKDVSLFGRRMLADIQAQYGEEQFEVNGKSYGRFHVPAQRVIGELASV